MPGRATGNSRCSQSMRCASAPTRMRGSRLSIPTAIRAAAAPAACAAAFASLGACRQLGVRHRDPTRVGGDVGAHAAGMHNPDADLEPSSSALAAPVTTATPAAKGNAVDRESKLCAPPPIRRVWRLGRGASRPHREVRGSCR